VSVIGDATNKVLDRAGLKARRLNLLQAQLRLDRLLQDTGAEPRGAFRRAAEDPVENGPNEFVSLPIGKCLPAGQHRVVQSARDHLADDFG